MTKLPLSGDKMSRSKITETEFEKLCRGIAEDAEVIHKHNPIGSREETLLWMLMSVLISFLSIEDSETPCFPGKSGAEAFTEAIKFILAARKEGEFEEEIYLEKMISNGF